MVRITWPLFVAGLVIMGVHHLPWPVRSQPSPSLPSHMLPSAVTCAAAPNGEVCPSEDPLPPPVPEVQSFPQPLPPPVFNGPSTPAVQPKEAVPSAGLPTWDEMLERAEQKVTGKKPKGRHVAQSPASPPAAPTPPPPGPTPPAPGPLTPPLGNDVPPPAGFPAPSGPLPIAPTDPPAPITPQPPAPIAPQPIPGTAPTPPGPITPPVDPATPDNPFYPRPAAKVVGGITVNAHGKLASSPWTFHLEVVEGRNNITAKIGKTVQFRVVCDKVDIQSPFGTIQAQGNVRVSSVGVEVMGETMTIQLQQDSMVLEGKAQMKCQRDGQEIELRSDRFSLRLSEINGQSSKTTPPPPPATSSSNANSSPVQPQSSPLPPQSLLVPVRPPVVDVSREYP